MIDLIESGLEPISTTNISYHYSKKEGSDLIILVEVLSGFEEVFEASWPLARPFWLGDRDSNPNTRDQNP